MASNDLAIAIQSFCFITIFFARLTKFRNQESIKLDSGTIKLPIYRHRNGYEDWFQFSLHSVYPCYYNISTVSGDMNRDSNTIGTFFIFY